MQRRTFLTAVAGAAAAGANTGPSILAQSESTPTPASYRDDLAPDDWKYLGARRL